MASIVNQVASCLEEIDMIGKSKKTARENGLKGIHSYRQQEHALSDSQNFAKWARAEQGIKKLHKLTLEHYQGYLEHLKAQGVTNGHLRNVETSLRLLQKGSYKLSERLGKDKITFTSEKRLIEPAKRGEGARNRSYSKEEVEKIMSKSSKNLSNGVKLMRGLGFRAEETVNLRAEHFQNGRVVIRDGTGITKGGRHRVFDIPKTFQSELENMLEGKQPQDRLVEMKVDSLRSGVFKTAKRAGVDTAGRGCHGFRHAYARERVEAIMNEEERKMLSRCLDRYLEGKSADYGVHGQKKGIYNSMKAKMDSIHAELGHGKNRFDLATRYMR